MKVLILEDDVTLAQVFFDALEDAGHEVALAHNNEQAIIHLRDNPYDILVFDLLIDGETSIPVLDYANFVLPKAEIILVTGSGLFPHGEMHYAVSGVAHRMQKPVKLTDLILIVEHLERTKSNSPARDSQIIA